MVLDINVNTPDRLVYSAKVSEIILPATTGQLGILTGHAPLVTALDTGILRFKDGKNWVTIILFGGIAEIDCDKVTILVNGVEEKNEIDNLRLTDLEKNLEKTTIQFETATTSRERVEATQNLKRTSSRIQLIKEENI